MFVQLSVRLSLCRINKWLGWLPCPTLCLSLSLSSPLYPPPSVQQLEGRVAQLDVYIFPVGLARFHNFSCCWMGTDLHGGITLPALKIRFSDYIPIYIFCLVVSKVILPFNKVNALVRTSLMNIIIEIERKLWIKQELEEPEQKRKERTANSGIDVVQSICGEEEDECLWWRC